MEHLEDVTTDVSANSLNNETLALDNLYGRILSAAFRVANARGKDDIQKVLRTVTSVCTRTPLSINDLSRLLKIKVENVSEALSSLHSVVYIPENTGSHFDVPCLHRFHHNREVLWRTFLQPL